MRLYLDLDTEQLISGPGTNDPLRSLTFKRGADTSLEIRVYQGGLRAELSVDASGIFTIKPLGKYDTTPLVNAGTWVKTGAGSTAAYTFTPSFNTAPLNALLGHGDDSYMNDIAEIVAMAEIEWIDAAGKHKTQTIQTTIQNDVVKETDDTPAIFPDPEEWAKLDRTNVFSEPQLMPVVSLAQGDGKSADLSFSNNALIVVQRDELGELLNAYIRLKSAGDGWSIADDNLTQERDYQLPDRSGVLSSLPPYANATEANAEVSIGDAWYDTTLRKTRVRLS